MLLGMGNGITRRTLLIWNLMKGEVDHCLSKLVKEQTKRFWYVNESEKILRRRTMVQRWW